MALRLTIVPTREITTLNGVPVRQWIGTTEKGICCTVYVRAIRVETETDNSEFESELLEISPLIVDDGD